MAGGIRFEGLKSGRDRVMVVVNVEGDKEVLARLKQFSEREARQIGSKAMTKVAAKIRKTMKMLAPVQKPDKKPRGQVKNPGALRKNIIASKFKRYRTGTIFTKVLLGTRKMMGIDARDRWYYPASMEFGYKTRLPEKELRRIKGRAWLAFEDTKANSKLEGWTHNEALRRARKARREILNARKKIPGIHFVDKAKKMHENDLLPAINIEINRAIEKLNAKGNA